MGGSAAGSARSRCALQLTSGTASMLSTLKDGEYAYYNDSCLSKPYKATLQQRAYGSLPTWPVLAPFPSCHCQPEIVQVLPDVIQDFKT